MDAIAIHALSKHFGSLKAVDAVDFQVKEGEIFSLLGPNGAGKSTTISMISGLLTPTSGDVTIFGTSIRREGAKAQSYLGVVPQEVAIYEDLSAQQNLMFWGRLYGLRGAQLRQRVDEVLELIELSDRRSQSTGKYSGGMKRRLNIGIALLHKPRLMILDEPTVGIDPQSRRKILDSVKELRSQGTTVLYTTHYMEEAEELSDRIGIIDHGKIIAMGTHAELVRLIGEKDRILLTISDPDRMAPHLAALPGVAEVQRENGQTLVIADNADSLLPRVFQAAQLHDAHIASVEIQEATLETVFLHLTGRALRDN
ncbi:MAG: ATP-binding cassette domain-containing protein [Anaerolineae bacterium]|nr:ATP-binding cassette domain-containing protein [Anaerolineae bacterium]